MNGRTLTVHVEIKSDMSRMRAAFTFATMLIAGAVSAASAQVSFVGTTSFRFNGSGAFASSATFQGVTVNSGTFNVFTSRPGNTQGWSNGGTLRLAYPASYDYTSNGTTLDVRLTFASPTAAFQTFDADVSGNIVANGNGIVVSFNNSPISNIPYSVPGATGTFRLGLFNFGATANASPTAITGSIREQSYVLVPTSSAVSAPEPASVVLFATGLIGVVGVTRRRRRHSA